MTFRYLPAFFGAVMALAAPGLAQGREDLPGLSIFGVPGHISMPSAFSLPDGMFALSVNAQGADIRRGNLVFQITPRITGVFRYGYLKDFAPDGSLSLYDRSFDIRFRVLDENPAGWRPAVTIGLQDFGGTGVYGAEYIVASRHFGTTVAASAGIGWGRLGSHDGFRNPLSILSDRFDDRPGTTGIEDTGKIAFDRFFRGDAAFFFGLDWRPSDRLRLSLEYSSDAMQQEVERIGFDYKSPVNIGLGYRFDNGAQLDIALLHGSTFSLGFSRILDPRRVRAPSGYEPGPPPVLPGAAGAAASWGGQPDRSHRDQLAAALRRQGLTLEGVSVSGDTALVVISDPTWMVQAQGRGRAARVISAVLPAEITTIRIRSLLHGMPMQEITLTRADLEELEYAPDGAWQIRSRSQHKDAVIAGPGAMPDPEIRTVSPFSWRLRPYLEPSFFDPDNPLRFDTGAELTAEWSPLPGVWLSGGLRQKLMGNLDQVVRESESVLPHVRSDGALYYRESGPRLPWLTAEWFARPGADLYSRVTLGLLEPMYGGISAELLWAPPGQRLALGVEVNHVRQRDYDGLGSLDYSVTTGHASAYYNIGGGFHGQVDAGRYLAGDWGATATLTRRFGNGIEVGAFFTLTDVGFTDFGEGAFDKGVTISVPLSAVTGRPGLQSAGVTLRPVLRDGGARLSVRNRLFGLTRPERDFADGAGWSRFWR